MSDPNATSAACEVVEVVQAPVAGQLLGRHVDRPLAGSVGDSFEVVGWVIPRAGGVAGVRVRADGETIAETELNHVRPDLASAFPDFEGAEQFGFRMPLGLRGSPVPREVEIVADLTDGSTVTLGTLRLRSIDSGSRAESSPRSDSRQRRRSRRWTLWGRR